MERPDTLFWNLPSESLQLQLGANQLGLSESEAHSRITQFGPNTLLDHG